MAGYSKIKTINRIFDANINRAKEGLRVCEEITRFLLNSRVLTLELKKTRHKIDAIAAKLAKKKELIKERDSGTDTGRNISFGELKRGNPADIFFANMQRVKEALRVLEEFAKLKDTKIAARFKRIRYQVYGLEKKAANKILSLRNHR